MTPIWLTKSGEDVLTDGVDKDDFLRLFPRLVEDEFVSEHSRVQFVPLHQDGASVERLHTHWGRLRNYKSEAALMLSLLFIQPHRL